MVINQTQAEEQILKLWDLYKTEWSNHIEFKQAMDAFTTYLMEKHTHLLNFKCNGSDRFYSQQRQRVEGWIKKHEKII
jgi:hypothetical protein